MTQDKTKSPPKIIENSNSEEASGAVTNYILACLYEINDFAWNAQAFIIDEKEW